MNHILVELMAQLTELSEDEQQAIEESFPVKTFKKGTYLIREGQVVQDAFYVVEGCIRAYKLIDGEEKTMAFYTENQSAVNFQSITHQTPSRQSFVCTEPTTVAILNAVKEQALYQQHPRFETHCRSGMEQMMGAKQEQLADWIALKPKQRYLKLMEERPTLLNRVPQYQLASYLGVKPETLSRIRKQLARS